MDKLIDARAQVKEIFSEIRHNATQNDDPASPNSAQKKDVIYAREVEDAIEAIT